MTEKDLDAHVSGTTVDSLIAALIAVTIVAAVALVLIFYLLLKKEKTPIRAEAAQRPFLRTGTITNVGCIGCYHTVVEMNSVTIGKSTWV